MTKKIEPASSIAAVGPQTISAHSIPSAQVVGLVIEQTGNAPKNGAAVLSVDAARALGRRLLTAADEAAAR